MLVCDCKTCTRFPYIQTYPNFDLDDDGDDDVVVVAAYQIWNSRCASEW